MVPASFDFCVANLNREARRCGSSTATDAWPPSTTPAPPSSPQTSPTTSASCSTDDQAIAPTRRGAGHLALAAAVANGCGAGQIDAPADIDADGD
jgi:hypothetical protein